MKLSILTLLTIFLLACGASDDSVKELDTDGDGKIDTVDLDDDNDGITDINDFYPLDSSKHLRDRIDLSTLSPSIGITMDGFVDYDHYVGNNNVQHSTGKVTSIGDVNNDEFSDVIIANAYGKEVILYLALKPMI